MAIILQRAIAANVPGLHGGIQAMAALSQEQRAQTAPALAAPFGTTFWVAVGLIGAALVPALLLPRLRHRNEDTAAVLASETKVAA